MRSRWRASSNSRRSAGGYATATLPVAASRASTGRRSAAEAAAAAPSRHAPNAAFSNSSASRASARYASCARRPAGEPRHAPPGAARCSAATARLTREKSRCAQWIAPATGGRPRVAGVGSAAAASAAVVPAAANPGTVAAIAARPRRSDSCAASISRTNWSSTSSSLPATCCCTAPRDSTARKLASSSKAPSAERSLRNDVSMSSRCFVVIVFRVGLWFVVLEGRDARSAVHPSSRGVARRRPQRTVAALTSSQSRPKRARSARQSAARAASNGLNGAASSGSTISCTRSMTSSMPLALPFGQGVCVCVWGGVASPRGCLLGQRGLIVK